jgi:hypothetical protein
MYEIWRALGRLVSSDIIQELDKEEDGAFIASSHFFNGDYTIIYRSIGAGEYSIAGIVLTSTNAFVDNGPFVEGTTYHYKACRVIAGLPNWTSVEDVAYQSAQSYTFTKGLAYAIIKS